MARASQIFSRRRFRVNPAIARLLDFRSAEERKVAIVPYDREFAFWQCEFLERQKKARWEKLKRAIV